MSRYFTEKVAQALQSLVLHDDAETLGGALQNLNLGMTHPAAGPPKLPPDASRPYAIVRQTVEAFLAAPESMSREDKDRFAGALWKLHAFFGRAG